MSLLASLLPSDTNNVILYEAQGTKLEALTVFIHNKETSSKVYSLAVVNKDEVVASKDYIVNAVSLFSKDTDQLSVSLTKKQQIVVSVGTGSTINFLVFDE